MAILTTEYLAVCSKQSNKNFFFQTFFMDTGQKHFFLFATRLEVDVFVNLRKHSELFVNNVTQQKDLY